MWGDRTPALLRWYLDSEHENIPVDVYRVFRDEFIKELLANEEGVTLPLNMGWMKIVGSQSPAEDRNTKKAPEKEHYTNYYKNYHTDGWVFKVYWYSRPIGKTEDIVKKAFFNSDAYGFKPNKPLRTAITAAIVAGKWDHFHRKGPFLAPRVRDRVGRPTNASVAAQGPPASKEIEQDED